MISKIFLSDFLRNKKNLFLKFFIPFLIVLVSYQFGYGRITLVMILLFTAITGAGLKIIKLKTSGIFPRLIISPLKKSHLFFEISMTASIFYFIQFIPALLVSVLYENIFIILYSFLAVLVVVIIGVLIGIHAKTLGEIHLYSIGFFIPLIALTMTESNLSYIIPFASIFHSHYTIVTFILPFLFVLILFFILFFDAKHL
jgi:hypothetical protein